MYVYIVYVSIICIAYPVSTSVLVSVLVFKGMRWAGHVTRMGEDRGEHRVLVGKPEGKSHGGDQDIDGRIILRWVFR
jgi:hypothetical protein